MALCQSYGLAHSARDLQRRQSITDNEEMVPCSEQESSADSSLDPLDVSPRFLLVAI